MTTTREIYLFDLFETKFVIKIQGPLCWNASFLILAYLSFLGIKFKLSSIDQKF